MQPKKSDQVYVTRDDGSRGLLDIYLPDVAPGERVPLVVWSSGSAFLGDDGKEGARDVAAALVPLGFAVAGVSVRSSRQALFPAQAVDAKQAIQWLRRNAADFSLDTGRFASMGNSSGGWFASMAALARPNDLGIELDGDDVAVQAAVAFYGPTDFARMDDQMTAKGFDRMREMFGIEGHADPNSPESLLVGAPIGTVPERVEAANPATYARADAPPMLLIHGVDDPLVPHGQSEVLYRALEAVEADATFVSVPDCGHDHPYVDDATKSTGRVVFSTRRSGPDLDLLREQGPTWASIAQFLTGAFGRGGAGRLQA